jgi:hypothetical protein
MIVKGDASTLLSRKKEAIEFAYIGFIYCFHTVEAAGSNVA